MENNTRVLVGGEIVSPLVEGDVRMIQRWVKVDLFKGVKFLYRGKEDLRIDGQIYKLFDEQCVPSLLGIKAASDNPMAVHLYTEKVWELATKRNLISNTLALRRSGVYTVMQNRFMDLCKICVANTIVFPAWESMENRLQNPTTYYVFYHNFLRAAVGEEDWKIAASTRTTATPTVANPTPRMSTSLNEAFALVLFKNNYFAWLLRAKQEHPGLVTDYDSDRGEATSSLVEFLLSGVVIELDEEKRDQHFLLMPTKTRPPADLSPADASALRAYQKATEQLKYTTQVLQASVRASVSYLRIQDALSHLQEQPANQEGQGLVNPEHLRKRKKRKLLKELKPYTARQGSEKAFRGWSKRAFIDLANYKRAIEEDYGLYAKFEQGYKQLYALQHAHKEDATTTAEDQPSIMLMEESAYEQLFDFSAVLPGFTSAIQ